MSQKIISIIPARGESKGIIRKNIKNLCNKPLVAYSIEQSIKASLIDETYVSTENDEIKKISLQYGAKVIDRPPEFATDSASTESVLLHACEHLNKDFDYMVLLQPTSPLRYPEQIDEAIKLFVSGNGDSLLSVYKNDSFLWDKKGTSINYNYSNRPLRQQKEWEYVENGSIYITKKEIILTHENRLGGKILFYVMPKWMSYQIDEPLDFKIIEYLFRENFYTFKIDLVEALKNLELVIFDVDGVFTDGSIYLDKDGTETMKFSRIDGKGIELIRDKGIKTAIITSEKSDIVKLRMEKLRIDHVYVGIKNKLKVYEDLKQQYSIEDKNICFLGDDIQDIEILKTVGLSCCPLNAQEIVKKHCIYISPFKGGEGFVRDVCNLIIKNKS